MDSSKNNIYQEDVTALFGMLESTESKTVDSVKGLIQENLSTTKDHCLLHGLVDYYVATQSTPALDILIRIREPHDKHLFYKITDCMRNDKTRYNSLLLLSHIVQRQPPWLYKITQFRTFQALLNVLRVETDPPCIMCALLSLVSLLPIIPSQMASHLNDVFDIFSRLVAWAVKPTGVSEVLVLHLQVGVYSLFHRLYGMYPCNFLGYLRSYYGGRKADHEESKVFSIAIEPMLSRVRLHPLLVTASNQAEQNYKRWRRMAPHDIIAQCANVSLDVIEGVPENIQSKDLFLDVASSNPSQDSSIQCTSLNSLSSNLSFTVEPNSVVNDANRYFTWSPSCTCDNSSPPPDFPSQPETGDTIEGIGDIQNQAGALNEMSINNATIESKLFIASTSSSIECPEKMPSFSSDFEMNEDLSMLAFNDSIQSATSAGDPETSIEGSDKSKEGADLFQRFETREEEMIDKEVSDLTSTIVKQSPTEIRHDTPFCSTTQNLTDKPAYSAIQPIDAVKVNEEETYDDTDSVNQEHSEFPMDFVHSMNRLRYFSYCGIKPDLPLEHEKPVSQRPSSCPNFNHFPFSLADVAPLGSYTSSASTIFQGEGLQDAKSNVHLQKGMQHSSVDEQSLPYVDIQYNPMAQSLPAPWKLFASEQSSISQCKSSDSVPYYYSFSPAELLDRHIQMGCETHVSQLCSIPLTSTRNINWTHFGGKPPADEVAILRKQILLLHNQLMFERHRREMHSERNRRLLGKAKRSQMREEHASALKDQVFLLQKENDELKTQLCDQAEIFRTMEKQMKLNESEILNNLKKLTQENNSLLYSNKKLQSLLVSQKGENDAIKDEKTLYQSQLANLSFDLELHQQDADNLQKEVNDLAWVSQQNVLLQELNQHYKDQLKFPKDTAKHDIEELINDASQFEIKNLRQMLECKTCHLDIYKAKISDLEGQLQIAMEKVVEETKLNRNMQAVHRDELLVRDSRLNDLLKISSSYETHVLELYQVQESLENELKRLKPNDEKTNSNHFPMLNLESECENFLVGGSNSGATKTLSLSPSNQPSIESNVLMKVVAESPYYLHDTASFDDHE